MNNRLKRKIALLMLVVLCVCNTGCTRLFISGNLGGNPVVSYDYDDSQIDKSLFENKYYYQQYNEDQQLTYREIYQGLMDQKDKFNVHGKDGEETNEIFFTVLYDFPELFWTDGEVSSMAYPTLSYVTVEPSYVCSNEERAQREAEIEMVTNQILASVPTGYSDYEKIKFVYEYVVNSVEYVTGAPDNQNIYSALVNKKSVCAGYAKETQYLLEKLGVPCIYVIGNATNDKGTDAHAWNIVLCDGKYYAVDSTWADPVFSGEAEETFNATLLYDYLCCSDAELVRTHVADSKYQYPKCESEDLNYHRLNHMYHENADRNTLLNAMKQTINVKGESTTFKFSDNTLYSQAKDLIVSELLDEASEYLGRRYGLRYVECHYSEFPQLNKFVIYWEY